MEEFNNLKRVAINELKKLNAAYANKDEFAETDVKKFDCLSHGLKCLLTAEAMLEAEEYEQETGVSSRRGRGADGRYVSRDGYKEGYERGYSEAMNKKSNDDSYISGFNTGYSEAMNIGASGHHPAIPYPTKPRW